jgi:cytochrome c556
MKGLGQSLKQNRCSTADLVPRLQTLRQLGNDLEPAFFPTQDDALFGKHAGSLRAALDAALAAPPSDCATAKLVIDKVGEGCKACHTDFKG